jgi:predicted 3-demethylubiquinone-9 3-methyltransferase (glyoxalase superfamily)
MTQIHTFLMFTGRAEEAMSFYVSLIPNSRVLDIKRYGKEEPGREGSVKLARFELAGMEYRCIDSLPVHAFTFTPSMSLFVDCDSEANLDRLYAALIEGGGALMPLGSYGFSRKFGWVNDRFSVSWQLNLA